MAVARVVTFDGVSKERMEEMERERGARFSAARGFSAGRVRRAPRPRGGEVAA